MFCQIISQFNQAQAADFNVTFMYNMVMFFQMVQSSASISRNNFDWNLSIVMLRTSLFQFSLHSISPKLKGT